MKKPRKPKPKAKRRAPATATRPHRASSERARPEQARARRTNGIRRGGALRRQARHRLSAFATSSTASVRQGLHDLAGLARGLSLEPVRTRLDRWHTAARSVTFPYARDERQTLLLLFLPFLLVATAIVVHQSARTLYAYVTLTATGAPEREMTPVRPRVAQSGPPPAELALSAASESAARPAEARRFPLTPIAAPPAIVSESATVLERLLPATTPIIEARRVLAASEIGAPAIQPDLVPTSPPRTIAPPSGPHRELALLNPGIGLSSPPRAVAPAPVDIFEADAEGRPILPGICSVAEAAQETPFIITGALETGAIAPVSLSPEAFGLRLARAAESQAAEAQAQSVVIYDDAYRSISYPMGDVHSMFGVCTDVVVRAYRALGIDLQALVHQTRSGRGDRNIDHRRTEVLRRFLATHGESLPISPFAEDYRPGDIVTYYRPQNRGSRSHIAVVSTEIAPSGRPMIVHNRGWGPQLEDALFVDRITGHYRYRGPGPTRDAAHARPGRAHAAALPSGSPEVAPAAIPVSFPAPVH